MQAVLKSPSTYFLRTKGILQDGCVIWNNSSKSSLIPCLQSNMRFCSTLSRVCSSNHVIFKCNLTSYNSDYQSKVLLYQKYGECNNFYPFVKSIHVGVPLWEKEPLKPSSKVEQTVNVIKEKATTTTPATAKVKKSIRERVWHEILHYYHGFRLLFIDLNISRKLLWRVLNGKSLSRREHRLLVRSVGDLFRLLPFSVFIIVPFMELLLPVAIKLFPGMLPSTFQTATEKDDKLKQSLKVRLEMAKFLQTTLDEMAVQSKDKGDKQSTKDFTAFFQKVRTTGGEATTEEILKFSKLFEDELTLDSLSRQQLTALCRVLDINPMGTTNFLRFQIRMKLRSLAADDKMIQKEGVESLTVSELQAACQARAMRAYGVSEDKLKIQLTQWLDLSLNEKVPPSLLLLSRALMLPDTIPATDQLKATISALPDTVELKAKAAIEEREGFIDNVTKIQLLKEEEKKIKEERAEQREEAKRQKETEEKEVLVDKAKVISQETDIASDTAQVTAEMKPAEQKVEELSTKDLEALEDALDALGKAKKRLIVEKEELDELKEEMQEYQEDVNELKQVLETVESGGEMKEIKETKAAKNLFKKVNSMISKMDTVLNQLEKNQQDVSTGTTVADKKGDDSVEIGELMEVIKKIQNVPDEARLAKISEILDKIDDDHDGTISVDEVLKVIELIGKEHVQLTTKQLDEIIELLEKEEAIEIETQIEKALEKQAPVEKIAAQVNKEKKTQAKIDEVKTTPLEQDQSSMASKQMNAMAVASPKTTNGTSANQTISDPKDTSNGTKKQL